MTTLRAARGNKVQCVAFDTQAKNNIVDRIGAEILRGATKGVAQQRVAESLGVSRRQIHQIWNGRPYDPQGGGRVQ
jgi:hypothetical protein